jgi:hypothetical protein
LRFKKRIVVKEKRNMAKPAVIEEAILPPSSPRISYSTLTTRANPWGNEELAQTSVDEILNTLLYSDYEDVVHHALKWKNTTKYSGTSTKALYHLTRKDDWERVLALSLQALSMNTLLDDTGITLAHCCQGYVKSGSRPVREGWIELAGYHAREVHILHTRRYLIAGIWERNGLYCLVL